MTVREVDDVDGLLVYHGLTAQNEARTLPETQLSNFIQFRGQRPPLRRPDRPAGPVQPALPHPAAPECPAAVLAVGLGGVRAQPIAHQLHIAKEVADRIAPACCWQTRWAWARPSKPA